MATGDKIFSSKEEFLSAKDTRGYMMCNEEPMRNRSTMCFLNVNFELSQRYHQIQLFSQQTLSSQTWIISFGEFSRRWMIISLHGYYDTFGKEGIIKFLVIWILVLGRA